MCAVLKHYHMHNYLSMKVESKESRQAAYLNKQWEKDI